MTKLVLHVQGVGFWSDAVPSWVHSCGVLTGAAVALDTPAPRPAPELLAPAERRRAPDTVAIGLHVATQAVQASGLDARDMASVFASAHGDLGTTNYLCETLARDPAALSPTKFIHSVHNAVSGHWGIATACTQPSVAMASHQHTFAMGLLEAASQCIALQAPVLLVAYDVQTMGPITQLTTSEGRMAVAMVLAPTASINSSHRITLDATACDKPPRPTPLTGLANNALADALPCLDALACASKGQSLVLGFSLGKDTCWTLTVESLA